MLGNSEIQHDMLPQIAVIFDHVQDGHSSAPHLTLGWVVTYPAAPIPKTKFHHNIDYYVAVQKNIYLVF